MNTLKIPVFFVLLLALSSCSSIKNYKYFSDIPDSLAVKQLGIAPYQEPRIQPDDILYIAIQTQDPRAGSSINLLNGETNNLPIANTSNVNATNVTANQSTYGYLVDKQGYVTVPVLGNVMLAGLDTQQARELLLAKANQYYKSPSLIVRFANFRVTVLGEVQRPGTYSLPNEKVSVLDALGYAGDLTIYGKRENVLLLRRQKDGNTTAIHLNLNQSSFFRSPYFYLQQNDQLYIEPNKAKINNSDGTQIRTISIVSAVLSLLIVVATRI